MSGDEALPIGRYVVGAPKQAPFGATGEVDSFSGSTNSQQNRILSGRMPKPSYNVAQPSIRAKEENNGGGVPQIVSPAAGGGIGGLASFQLYASTDPIAIGVYYGLINGEPPSGMDTVEPFLIYPNNQNIVYVSVQFNNSTREITSRTISNAASLPTNNQQQVYFSLGKVGFDGTNYSIIYQDHIGNINFREYLVSINGILYRDYIKTFTLEPVEIVTVN